MTYSSVEFTPEEQVKTDCRGPTVRGPTGTYMEHIYNVVIMLFL